MAYANNTNNAAALCTIFLGEGTWVKLSYVSIYTGPVGDEIKFGTLLDFVTFVPSLSRSPTEVQVPRMPSRGHRSRVIPPTEFQDDVFVARTSVFNRLTFPKRVINI